MGEIKSPDAIGVAVSEATEIENTPGRGGIEDQEINELLTPEVRFSISVDNLHRRFERFRDTVSKMRYFYNEGHDETKSYESTQFFVAAIDALRFGYLRTNIENEEIDRSQLSNETISQLKECSHIIAFSFWNMFDWVGDELVCEVQQRIKRIPEEEIDIIGESFEGKNSGMEPLFKPVLEKLLQSNESIKKEYSSRYDYDLDRVSPQYSFDDFEKLLQSEDGTLTYLLSKIAYNQELGELVDEYKALDEEFWRKEVNLANYWLEEIPEESEDDRENRDLEVKVLRNQNKQLRRRILSKIKEIMLQTTHLCIMQDLIEE